jgi:Holliday junction resolvasome RuvABC DNA-binding subunit
VRENSLNAVEQAKEDAIEALERLGISREVADGMLREAQQQGEI